jgi:hypothetical protein
MHAICERRTSCIALRAWEEAGCGLGVYNSLAFRKRHGAVFARRPPTARRQQPLCRAVITYESLLDFPARASGGAQATRRGVAFPYTKVSTLVR